MRYASCSSRFSSLLVGLAVALVTMILMIPRIASADEAQQYDSFDQWISQTKITGQLRFAYYTVDWQHIHPFQHSSSFGGWLNLKTAPFHNFSIDVTLNTAQALGLNPTNLAAEVPELPATNVSALSQAYLQYKHGGVTVRGGNQAINTPFANESDFRMIPATFQGVSAVWADALPGLTLSAYRMYRFKPWWATGFERTDTGNSPFNAGQVPAVDSIGFAAFGAEYQNKSLKLSGWYYDMYNRLDLMYGEASYHVAIGGHFLKALILGTQALRESNTSSQVAPYRDVNSKLYGAQLGFVVPHNVIFVSYNDVPTHDGSFQAGGFVDPYLQGNFNSSPIYTDIFGMSLGSQFGLPGQGYSIKDVIKLDRLTLIPGYTNYHLISHAIGPSGEPVSGPGNINGWMLLATYNLTPHWQIVYSGAFKQSKSKVGRISPNFFMLKYDFGGASGGL